MVRSEWVDSSSSTCSWKKQYVMELIARRLPLFYSQIHNRQDCSQWSSQRTSNKTDMKLFHTSAYRNGATANGRTDRTLFCIHAQFQPPKIHLIFTRMDHRLIWLWPIYVIIRWRTPLLKSHWLEKTSVKSLLRFIFGHWNWTTQIRAWTNPKEPWVI